MIIEHILYSTVDEDYTIIHDVNTGVFLMKIQYRDAGKGKIVEMSGRFDLIVADYDADQILYTTDEHMTYEVFEKLLDLAREKGTTGTTSLHR